MFLDPQKSNVQAITMKLPINIPAAQLAWLLASTSAYAANVLIGPGIDPSVASSNQFVSVGDSNTFAGIYAQMAVGDGNILAVESSGLVIGWSNSLNSESYGSLVVGMSNSSNAAFSFISGEGNTIEQKAGYWNTGNSVIGNYNKIRNHGSSIILGAGNDLNATGYGDGVIGYGSLVAGQYNMVDSYGAYVIGISNEVSGDGTIALGWGLINHYYTSAIIGTNNLPFAESFPTWSEEGPAFVVGNGNHGSKSNAIVTLKNGQTTFINKAWKAYVQANSNGELSDPPAETTDSGGNALVVDGHAVLNGKVIISVPQGDISMGIYGAD